VTKIRGKLRPSGHRPWVSPKRELKRELMAKHGITTGRQLKKLRRRLRQLTVRQQDPQ